MPSTKACCTDGCDLFDSPWMPDRGRLDRKGRCTEKCGMPSEVMNLKDQINQISKEIEVYSSHALHSLAKQRCVELAELARGSAQLTHKEALLEAISRKINSIEEDARNFEGIGKSTKMSSNEFDIVKRLVFVSDEADNDAADWEVARACLILGQYDKALLGFNRLIDKRYKLVPSAKNVLRCCIGMSAMDDAIAKYHEWFLSGIFSLDQLENIRTFLQEILYKKNINTLLSKPRVEGVDHEQGTPDDEYIDIIAVKLCMNGDSSEGMEAMLDVTYQKGEKFNVVVPKNNQALLDFLKIGKEIKSLELYSSSIIFTDQCRVCEISKIKSGSRQGDYSVCMTIMKSD